MLTAAIPYAAAVTAHNPVQASCAPPEYLPHWTRKSHVDIDRTEHLPGWDALCLVLDQTRFMSARATSAKRIDQCLDVAFQSAKAEESHSPSHNLFRGADLIRQNLPNYFET